MKFACSLSFLACVLAAQPALCQERTDSALSDPFLIQRYLSASTGVASPGANKSNTLTFSAEYGEKVTRNSQAYVNFTYFDDVMTNQMRDNLAAAAANIKAITGVSRSFSGRDRGLAFTAGGKYQPGTWIRPYIGAGAGAFNIERTITEGTLGDVSLAFAEQTPYWDGVVSRDSMNATKPLAEAVAGIGFVTRSMYIDLGYRYRHVFHTATDIDLSQVVLGIGAKW
jgi:opacity protein-like surface antigen